MRDTEYAYAVARIRCHEQSLLGAADLAQLTSAPSYADAVRKLGELGYEIPASGSVSQALSNKLEQTWELLREIAPDKSELEVFGVRNAFHNLKSALKVRVSASKDGPYYLYPSCVEDSVIEDAVNAGNVDSLPEYMRDAEREAYEVLTACADGQLGEAVIDKQSLKMFLEFAQRTKCEELIKAAQIIVATSDIKIAYRCAVTGKTGAFLEASLCPCPGLDISKLVNASSEGMQAIADYLKQTPYAEAGELIIKSSASFEKWCDDSVTRAVKGGRYEAFGFLPLVGFFFARETEVKNIRIIMSAKETGMPNSVTEERLRELYV